MVDVLLPTYLKIARLNTQYLDNTGMTRGLYTGAPETTGFGGDRLRMSLEFTPTSSKHSVVERAALRVFLARLRGRQNRAILWDPSYRGPRGAFKNFAFELLSNNTFANGTTGWSASSAASLAVTERVVRISANSVFSSTPNIAQSPISVSQYAPYALRGMFIDGAGFSGLASGPSLSDGTTSVTDYSTARGLRTATLVSLATTVTPLVVAASVTSGFTAGDYIDVPYTSLSRPALVDNRPNAATQSDDITHSDWTTTGTGLSTVTANASTSPNGTTTADAIVENSSNSAHFFTRTLTRASAAEDWVIWGYFARGSGTRNVRLSVGTDASNVAICNFDLGTGTPGAPSVVGTVTHARTFMRNAGAYYLCCVVGRLTATTGVYMAYNMLSGTTATYTGDGSSSLVVWRCGAARSSFPVSPMGTTTAATSGTSQTGNALHLKGLPASTSGLLLPDDRFEVITSRGSEMKIVTAALDSDAAGLGYLQFEPPLRGIPANNAPVIIVNPMTKAIFAGDVVGWDDNPGILTTASAEFEEAA